MYVPSTSRSEIHPVPPRSQCSPWLTAMVAKSVGMEHHEANWTRVLQNIGSDKGATGPGGATEPTGKTGESLAGQC